MQKESEYNKIVEIVENGFGEVAGSITEIVESIRKIKSTIRWLKAQVTKLSKKQKNFEELDKFFSEVYYDYDFITTPISDAMNFIINLETMVYGDDPMTPEQIYVYMRDVYGKRMITYINAAIRALGPTTREEMLELLKTLREVRDIYETRKDELFGGRKLYERIFEKEIEKDREQNHDEIQWIEEEIKKIEEEMEHDEEDDDEDNENFQGELLI